METAPLPHWRIGPTSEWPVRSDRTAAADGAEAARPGGEPDWPLDGAGALGRAGRGAMGHAVPTPHIDVRATHIYVTRPVGF